MLTLTFLYIEFVKETHLVVFNVTFFFSFILTSDRFHQIPKQSRKCDVIEVERELNFRS